MPRVLWTQVDCKQIEKVAKFVSTLPEERPFNSYSFFNGDEEIVASDNYPALDDPHAIDFFFATCLHQHGFWLGNDQGYEKPLTGILNGREEKGSDLLEKAAMRTHSRDPEWCSPKRLSTMSKSEFRKIFSDDNGPIPFPDIDERVRVTNEFGKWFEESYTTPSDIVERCNTLFPKEALKFFLSFTAIIPGYKEDPIQKKGLLLAMALNNRPEQFLKVKDTERWRPIVDYHLMRVSLRLGFIKLTKRDEAAICAREWVDADTELGIRLATHAAVMLLIALSGRPMSQIDVLLWMARRYCPEMKTPDCAKCVFISVCEKKVNRFQPVFRTWLY
jgi:hypothetical protein